MGKCFEHKSEKYDELFDVIPGSLVVKGQAAQVQDVFGFYLKEAETLTEEVIFLYRCKLVEAVKKVGSAGEAIVRGDKLYYYPGVEQVSPVKSGVAGTDYYFCGWARESAGASVTTVLMRFDGTMWELGL
jgi:hypothetical protein